MMVRSGSWKRSVAASDMPMTPVTPVRTGTPVTSWRRFLSFPNPVNDHAARVTAGLVMLLAAATMLSNSVWGHWSVWGYWLLAAGFVLRVLFGPRVSPLALLSVRVVTPFIERLVKAQPVLVPGPPKRFAQAIGAGLSLTAAIAASSGLSGLAALLLVFLMTAAALEAVLGFCLGCAVFGFLQRRGVIPESVCTACAQFTLRQGR